VSRVVPELQPVDALRSLVRVPEPGEHDRAVVGLDRNERLAPLPPWFVERLRGLVDSDLLTGYPVADRLYAVLAEQLSLERSQLLLAPGSDAVAKGCFHAYVERGDTVVALDPSYAMYAVYAEMYGARRKTVPFERLDGVQVERLLEAIEPGVKLVTIANPNQPTGTLLTEDELLAIVRAAADVGALVLVDEAYFPFSDATILPRVPEHANLAVARTFSKAAGFAGLRIGYVAAPSSVIDVLFKVRSVHDVNAFAIAAATALLEHPEVVDGYVEQVRAGGELLRERAEALGLAVEPIHANFALVRVAGRIGPGELVERLAARGFRIRGPFSASPLQDHVRVTLGPPELMASFCAMLADALESAQS
jgi:histidinol-phosphate aminotransferase